MVIKKKAVLIIDDDPDFVSLARTILEAKGMEVVAVATIAEARASLSREVPNVILLDMELQNESGVDFLKERANNAQWTKIPVVVCSSQNHASIVKSAIRFGADDYLLKPIKQTWLIQRVRKILIKEDNLTHFFKADEEVELLVAARPVSATKTTFIARANVGFDKGVTVSATIPSLDGKEVVTTNFKSDEKSRYSSRGPFDTLFSTADMMENEKNRVQMLKTFWRFDD